MEKKNYYTLKEIILGLSDEYQIHQHELQKLKELCTADEKKVLDFYFRIYQPEYKNPILLCEYNPKQNSFQKFVTDFSKRIGYYIYGRNTARLVTDNNEYYFLCGFREYPIHVKYDYGIGEEFYQQATRILNSNFSNNMRSKYIEKNELGMDAALTITTSQVNLYIRKKCGNLPSSVLWYDSSEEVIGLQSFEKNINKQYLSTILDIGFPISELNPYHIQKIESSEKKEKPIDLQYEDSENSIQLAIKEEEKSVVLCKKK